MRIWGTFSTVARTDRITLLDELGSAEIRAERRVAQITDRPTGSPSDKKESGARGPTDPRLDFGSTSVPASLKELLLKFNSFDFIERNLILGPIIEFRGAGRLVRGDLLSMFEGATVLQISGNPGRSECMAAGGIGKGGCFGPPLYHVKHVTADHRIAGELVALFEAPE